MSNSRHSAGETPASAQTPEPQETEEESPRTPASRRVRWIVRAAALIVVLIAGTVAAVVIVNKPHEDALPDPVAATIPVAITANHVPKETTLGVILTLGTEGQSGSEWSQAAQGVVVAQRRLAEGGAKIKLIGADDRGSADGATAAVAKLVKQKVTAIVVATAGPNAQEAANAAAQAGIPAVMVYDSPAGTNDLVFSTAPTAEQVSQATSAALAGRVNVLLISAETSDNAAVDVPGGVSPAQTLVLQQGADVDALARQVAIRTGDRPQEPPKDAPAGTEAQFVEKPSDAVVVSASPLRLATVARALQAAGVTVPIELGVDATSPAFADALTANDGAVSSQLLGIGAAWGDATALQHDGDGRAMSAFLAGVRLTAQDTSVTNLTGDVSFSEVAKAADSRSHDAVIALVRAVSAANSTDPNKVGTALRGLTLGANEGIAGLNLDFSHQNALTGNVTPVYASAQDLGLRPVGLPIVWTPVPAK